MNPSSLSWPPRLKIKGDHWYQGPINAPTVLNSSMNLAQFWDGRAADFKAQTGGPIANPGEMGFSHELAVGVLQSIPAYVSDFKMGGFKHQVQKVLRDVA